MDETVLNEIPLAGTFGYDSFTVDWYEVFMAWGLVLPELKQLAMNSLRYSSLSDEEIEVTFSSGITSRFIK